MSSSPGSRLDSAGNRRRMREPRETVDYTLSITPVSIFITLCYFDLSLICSNSVDIIQTPGRAW